MRSEDQTPVVRLEDFNDAQLPPGVYRFCGAELDLLDELIWSLNRVNDSFTPLPGPRHHVGRVFQDVEAPRNPKRAKWNHPTI